MLPPSRDVPRALSTRLADGAPLPRTAPDLMMARWQNGYVADCKSVNAGSIPARASIRFSCAQSALRKSYALRSSQSERSTGLLRFAKPYALRLVRRSSIRAKTEVPKERSTGQRNSSSHITTFYPPEPKAGRGSAKTPSDFPFAAPFVLLVFGAGVAANPFPCLPRLPMAARNGLAATRGSAALQRGGSRASRTRKCRLSDTALSVTE